MIHYNYSPNQLEDKAETFLRQFDAERLVKTKPIDVYEVIEKCLDVPYDWKYITPDQSVLGLTAFKSGTLWVWPESHYKEGIMPYEVYLSEGTILIDSTLTEKEERGPENFTVMHEIFHQVLHKRCFQHCNPDYTHATYKKALGKSPRTRPRTSLEICEYQANACAASFLMPRELLTTKVTHYRSSKLLTNNREDLLLIRELASEFSVSPTAMRYRLLNLGLAV